MAISCGTRRLRLDERGNVALLAALALPVALLFAGAAVDFQRYNASRATLQEFADTLAIKGAKELSLSGVTTDYIRRVVEAAAGGGLADDFNIGEFAMTVSVDLKGASVTVDLTQPSMKGVLLPQFKPYSDDFAASATAVARGGSNVCIIALDDAASATIDASFSSKVSAPDCALLSNSSSSTGVKVSGSSTVTASLICSSGGYSGASSAFTPAPMTDCPPTPDPLSERAPPPYGPCDYTNKIVGDRSQTTIISALTASFAEMKGSTTQEMTRTPYTLDPGVYCGGLIIGANASATLNPGVYVMKDGPLSVDLNGEIKGQNVGFYLVGDKSTFVLGPDSKIDLSAPRDGPMAGVLFFEDAAAPLGRTHSILSNDARNLLGTFYLPKGTLLVSTISPIADQSAYTAIVARKLKLVGSPTLVLNTDYGLTDVPVPDGIGPVGVDIFLRN
jgi:hypothetical protein